MKFKKCEKMQLQTVLLTGKIRKAEECEEFLRHSLCKAIVMWGLSSSVGNSTCQWIHQRVYQRCLLIFHSNAILLSPLSIALSNPLPNVACWIVHLTSMCSIGAVYPLRANARDRSVSWISRHRSGSLFLSDCHKEIDGK